MTTIKFQFTTIRAKLSGVANELDTIIKERRIVFGPEFTGDAICGGITRADFNEANRIVRERGIPGC